MSDVNWCSTKDALIISPEKGGRIISWRHCDKEIVYPIEKTNGGLARVLFADERFPGSSYTVPHIITEKKDFAVSMRYIWNTPNMFAKLFDFDEKANLLYVDGLLLDKTISFFPEKSSVSIDIRITNLSNKKKVLVPWIHNDFLGIFDDAYMVIDGQKVPYIWMDIFWDGHRVKNTQLSKIIGVSREKNLFVTLGVVSRYLSGMAAYTEKTNGLEFSNEAALEFRFSSVSIEPGFCFHSRVFISISENQYIWHKENPVDVISEIEKINTHLDISNLIGLLPLWALEEEKQNGLMIISYLDKLPFSSEKRYSANCSFSHFIRHRDTVVSYVVLVPLRNISVDLSFSKNSGWMMSLENEKSCGFISANLKVGKIYKLKIIGQPELLQKNNVQIKIASGQKDLYTLRIEKDASIEKKYRYQVKQVSFYCDERFRKENSGFSGKSSDDFLIWQKKLRKKHTEWLRRSVVSSCNLSPRIVERQIGINCIRDKILVQTEPGMWIPSYVVYPKNVKRKMPAVLFFHGSGPGKQAFVPDEEKNPVRLELSHDLENIAYRLASEMGYLVYCPDQRGWGEWGESSYAQQPQRAKIAGYNMLAMMMWDHIRSIDYLCTREDVDSSRIGCFGASGGGLATIYTAGIDERVKAAIISSSIVFMPYLSEEFFFKFKGFENDLIFPDSDMPSATVYTCALTIPRALWLMEGKNDTVAVNANITSQSKVEIEEKMNIWRERVNNAWNELKRLYNIAGASDMLKTTWMDGGHCCGMTYENISGWFKQFLGTGF